MQPAETQVAAAVESTLIPDGIFSLGEWGQMERDLHGGPRVAGPFHDKVNRLMDATGLA